MINATGNPSRSAVDKFLRDRVSNPFEFNHQLSGNVPPAIGDDNSEENRRVYLARIPNAEGHLVGSLSTFQHQRNTRLRVGFTLEEKECQQGGGFHEGLDSDCAILLLYCEREIAANRQTQWS